MQGASADSQQLDGEAGEEAETSSQRGAGGKPVGEEDEEERVPWELAIQEVVQDESTGEEEWRQHAGHQFGAMIAAMHGLEEQLREKQLQVERQVAINEAERRCTQLWRSHHDSMVNRLKVQACMRLHHALRRIRHRRTVLLLWNWLRGVQETKRKMAAAVKKLMRMSSGAAKLVIATQVLKHLQVTALQQWLSNYRIHAAYMAGIEFEAVRDLLHSTKIGLRFSQRDCASRMLAGVRGEFQIRARAAAVAAWRLNLSQGRAVAMKASLLAEAAGRQESLAAEAMRREEELTLDIYCREETYQQALAAAWEVRVGLTQECRTRGLGALRGIPMLWLQGELRALRGWKHNLAQHLTRETRRGEAAARLLAMPIWMDGVASLVIRTLLLRWHGGSTAARTLKEQREEALRHCHGVAASRMLGMQVWFVAAPVLRACVRRWSQRAERAHVIAEIGAVWLHCTQDEPARIALLPSSGMREARQALAQLPAYHTELQRRLAYWRAEGGRARQLYEALQTAERCLESREYTASDAEGLVDDLEASLEETAGELAAKHAALSELEARREAELVQLRRIEELEAEILQSLFHAESLVGSTEERQVLIARNTMLASQLEELNGAKKGVEKQKHSLQEANAKLKQQVKAHEQQAAALKKETQVAQHRVAEMEATLTLSLTHHMDSSREKTDKATAETEQARQEAAALRSEVAQLTDKLQALEAAEAKRVKAEEEGILGRVKGFGF